MCQHHPDSDIAAFVGVLVGPIVFVLVTSPNPTNLIAYTSACVVAYKAWSTGKESKTRSRSDIKRPDRPR